MKNTFLLSLVVLAFSVTTSAQIKSVYTSTKTNSCKTLESNTDEGGSYVGECRGVAGYRVRLSEGDIRQTLDIVSPKGAVDPLNFTSYFGAFSYVGERLEWRVKGGKPYALIARFNVADPEGIRKSTSYLMISKVSDSGSCVTDIVEPGRGQNEKARKLADEAPGKQCKSPN